jgi:anti-sigma factor RsiW
MVGMIGHLGPRASALLDGQLSAEEEERAWAHVHTCHQCRDLVEREGWVKTRLAGLTFDSACAPSDLTSALKGSLLAAGSAFGCPPGESYLSRPQERPRWVSAAALGGGAAAAVMGVLAFGAAPADAPTMQRQTPYTSVGNPVPAVHAVQQRRTGTTP